MIGIRQIFNYYALENALENVRKYVMWGMKP
jgi:hypothetical protein